jgi:hypothetical protein
MTSPAKLHKLRNFSVATIGVVVFLVAGSPAQAALTLTPAGISRGLSLTTYATGFPVNTAGPLGVDVLSNGKVLVTTATGNIQLFPDVDGQSAASTPVLVNYGYRNSHGLAHVGSTIYMTQAPNGTVVQLNLDGTINHSIVSGIFDPIGMVANPANGHLFVSSDRILDIDPIAGSFTPLANIRADGLSISPDGKTLYAAASTGHILGFDTKTGAGVFDSGFIAGGIDGSALGAGPLAGTIYANNNDGTVVEVNLQTQVQTLIATNGSRGDFVTVDPADGTLLLTQLDSIVRLHGTFVPEPDSMVLIGSAVLCVLGVSRRKIRSYLKSAF